MNADERRKKTRENIKNGNLSRCSLVLPQTPGQAAQAGIFGVCGATFHRCAGFGEDKPDIEVVDKKTCFHTECYKEWMEDCRP